MLYKFKIVRISRSSKVEHLPDLITDSDSIKRIDLATKFISLKRKDLKGCVIKTWAESFYSCIFLTYNCDQISDKILLLTFCPYYNTEVLVNVNNIYKTSFHFIIH